MVSNFFPIPSGMVGAECVHNQGGVIEVLTNDHHFTQEGFTILYPGP
jgi:hypothetical protein